MDQRLKTICKLLDHPDNMRRCGAAAVLAELAPKDPGAVKALGESLGTANQALMPYVLEALEAIGSKTAIPYVMPLLNSDDPSIGLRAVAILSKAGASMIPEIKRRLEHAKPRERLILLDMLARIHNVQSFTLILNMLFDSDFEFVKQTCEAVRRHIGEATPKERQTLHKLIAEFASGDRVSKRERVLTSCLLLLGSIGQPEARTFLLKHTSPKASPYVRRHALIALKGLQITATQATALAGKISVYLGEDDPEVVRRAVDVIEALPSSCFTSAQWRKLLKSRHAPVRAFAARTIAGIDTTANNTLLVNLLSHDDNNVREIAASTLASRKKATQPLLAALAMESDPDPAWHLARILKPHCDAIDKKTLKQFATLAEKAMLTGDALHEPLMYFLRNADARGAESVTLAAGMQCKKEKKWQQAVDYLRRLLHTESFDDNVSYALSVCDLKASAKELAPHLRAKDHALRGFHSLRYGTFKLLAELKKDKTLDAADLYYVGFHFCESIGDDKDFGAQVLEIVAQKWSSSKDGKAARNKLKLIRPPKERTRKKVVASKKHKK